MSALGTEIERLRSELSRVTAERDAAMKDAERYRWLRKLQDFPGIFIGVDSPKYPSRWALMGNEADTAIDTAIAQEEKKI